MKTIVALIISMAFFCSCNSQNLKSKAGDIKKPHENITVTKRYDENGNLIELDSVYTSYYSNIEGDTLRTDSMMYQFSEFFKSNINKAFSDGFYSGDSMIIPGFFHDDFFENQFMEQSRDMQRMIQQMDSIKNSFFNLHSRQYMKQR